MSKSVEERLQSNKEAVRRYSQTPKGRVNSIKSNLISRSLYRQKTNARQLVRDRVKYGKLIKPEICSLNTAVCNGRIEAHHEDYNKPAEVIWWCVMHHGKAHNERI